MDSGWGYPLAFSERPLAGHQAPTAGMVLGRETQLPAGSQSPAFLGSLRAGKPETLLFLLLVSPLGMLGCPNSVSFHRGRPYTWDGTRRKACSNLKFRPRPLSGVFQGLPDWTPDPNGSLGCWLKTTFCSSFLEVNLLVRLGTAWSEAMAPSSLPQ